MTIPTAPTPEEQAVIASRRAATMARVAFLRRRRRAFLVGAGVAVTAVALAIPLTLAGTTRAPRQVSVGPGTPFASTSSTISSLTSTTLTGPGPETVTTTGRSTVTTVHQPSRTTTAPSPTTQTTLSAASTSTLPPQTWNIEDAPSPAGATTGYLNSVSCRAKNVCEAVGGYYSEVGPRSTLAEGWNGTTWEAQNTPEPAGTTTATFYGVSCTSANICEAVGDYVDSPGTLVALAEVWDGATWKVQSIPNPTGANSVLLNAVSCTAADACEAVGQYSTGEGDGYMTLAEVWNGTTWSLQSTPDPGGTDDSQLDAVSCTAANECEAVGHSQVNFETLAEAWNGKSWQLQSTPDPSTSSNYFEVVTCTSANACEAVGGYDNSADVTVMLAAVWNGTSWNLQNIPGPPDTTARLSGAACTAANACEAVGQYQTDGGTVMALAEVWNGTTWKPQKAPNPAGANSTAFSGVSCPGMNSCQAVGAYEVGAVQESQPLAESYSG